MGKGGAPKGNEYWKLRSKHGRDKLFETPELLWEAACEYFQWCNEHPWKRREAIKSGEMAGEVMEIDTERPYTLSGLCLYLGCNEAYFRIFKSQLPEGEQDFNTVISAIEQTIYTQKFEGAAVGSFNANIIARDLGLSEKTDFTSKGEQIKSPVLKLPDGTTLEI
jgi:hypothetical protein